MTEKKKSSKSSKSQKIENLENIEIKHDLLRLHPEQQFKEEFEELAKNDKRQRPPSWKLSPWAVVTYIMGGILENGFEITPKYIGNRRIIETCIATLATDRALLLLGVPGTAKTWLSEHISSAISGDSKLIVQGTAGTAEESIRYGWNYARLLSEGPSENAIVSSPIMRAMKEGKIARVEELTRIPSDVQDALLTILSEKALPIPEINQEIQAIKGFNIIATANDRDKGVNDLSSALKRRFNTVILPVPETLEEEVQIVRTRVENLGKSLEIPAETPAMEEVKKIVSIFRELRSGITEDGKTKLKATSGSMSTAEAISVITNSLSLSAHFGDGTLTDIDIASGITGAIIKDPIQDKIALKEYIENVLKERDELKGLYNAFREVI